MNTKELISAVEKHGKMSKADAQRAVQAVFGTLRDSKHATMIFREVEGKDTAVADRKIFLCG